MNSSPKSLPYKKSLQAFLVVSLCLLIYLPSLRNGFIWDDDQYLYKNPWVQKTEGLRVIWFTNKIPQYYPVVFTSFWLEHKLWGLRPFGYHCVNLALHILNALLFFWLALKIFPRIAFISALLFAIHPIQVETVAWVAERKNLLSLFFFLSAVLAYLGFDRTRKIRYYLLAFVMFIFALLSKSIAVCFISVPVLYKWWQDAKFSWREIRLSIAFAATGLAVALYTVYLELYHVGAQGEAFDLTFLERFVLSGRVIFFYIYKICFPFNFMFFYPRWRLDISVWWQWLFPLAVILALGALAYYRRRIPRGAAALFIFYIISIFPALGFINFYPMQYSFIADHFSYLSTPGLLLLLCAGASLFFDRMKSRFPFLCAAPYRIIKPGLFIFIVIYLGGKSMALALNYKDQATLWKGLIKVNPGAWMAYNNLANLYYDMGKKEEAIPLFKKVIELNPGLADGYNNLAVAYGELGQKQEALGLYRKAIEINPGLPDIYNNLANLYGELGQKQEALDLYRKAAAISRNPAEGYNSAAISYSNMGRKQEAVALFKKAIAADPNYAITYNNLGFLYSDMGRKQEAVALFKKAIALAPKPALAYNNLANLYSDMGRKQEALALYKQALALEPDYALTYNNLAVIYSELEKKEEAIALFKKAISVDPNYAITYYNLGNLCADLARDEEAIDAYRKTIGLNPDHAAAHFHLARAYLRKKEYDLALKHCDRAIALGYQAPSDFLSLLEPHRK